MASVEDLLAEILRVQKEQLEAQEQQTRASGGSLGGPASTIAAANTAASDARGAFQAAGQGNLLAAANRVAVLGGKGVKVAALGFAGAALGAVAQPFLQAGAAAAKGGIQSFVSSGGSLAAGEGGARLGLSRFLSGGLIGELTGATSATSISDRARSSVASIAEAAARAGGPLSKAQLTGLVKQAQARETRVEDANRLLSTVQAEQFGSVDKQESGKAGDRLNSTLAALNSTLQQLIASGASRKSK